MSGIDTAKLERQQKRRKQEAAKFDKLYHGRAVRRAFSDAIDSLDYSPEELETLAELVSVRGRGWLRHIMLMNDHNERHPSSV
jgi:hypothetical protein